MSEVPAEVPQIAEVGKRGGVFVRRKRPRYCVLWCSFALLTPVYESKGLELGTAASDTRYEIGLSIAKAVDVEHSEIGSSTQGVDESEQIVAARTTDEGDGHMGEWQFGSRNIIQPVGQRDERALGDFGEHDTFNRDKWVDTSTKSGAGEPRPCLPLAPDSEVQETRTESQEAPLTEMPIIGKVQREVGD